MVAGIRGACPRRPAALIGCERSRLRLLSWGAMNMRRSEAWREEPEIPESADPRYGAPQLIQPRLGQGTFRIVVTEAYGRTCAVTSTPCQRSKPLISAP